MSSTNKEYRSKSISELINIQAGKLENFCEQEELIQSTAAHSCYYHADYRAMKQQLLFAFKFFALTSVYLFTRSRTPATKIKCPEKSLAVLFLLENLKRILVYNAHLIHNAKNQVEMLENDISLFKALLEDSTKVRRKDEALQELHGRIRDLVSEAEHTVEVFSNMAAENSGRNFFQRAFSGPIKLISVAKEVRAIRAKVKIIYDKIRVVSATRRIGGAAPEDATPEEKKAYVM